ncbi:MAG: hypothetical protein LPJ95_07825 [Paracoccaceae bacterium]|nr:hypothetical protein [Paracoccaceae bacterium]
MRQHRAQYWIITPVPPEAEGGAILSCQPIFFTLAARFPGLAAALPLKLQYGTILMKITGQLPKD